MRWTVLLAFIALRASLPAQWAFTGDTTVTWEQCVSRYTALATAHHGAHLLEIGHDDDGSPIHLFVITDGSPLHPDSIRAQGKNILWITNAIHPGEPDGVDASLMLAQALLEDDHLMGLTAHTVVCIVPMYNVWGAKQRQHATRPDQNGPAEHGIRANAQNLDLNRDFIKMDAQNTWAMVRALSFWDPDVYFETHVSDGADHQYVMELLTTQKDKLDPSLSRLMTGTMIPELHAWMARKKILMCPYFETVAEVPDSGLIGFNDGPRYSTGYNALFDRIGILAESHMLKPYADRVNATFQLMLATLAVMDRHSSELTSARATAKRYTAEVDEFGFNWELQDEGAFIEWKGYRAGYKPSAVSGLPRLYYDHAQPTLDTVPWFDTYRASLVIRKPTAYLVPRVWEGVVDRLYSNGVRLEYPNADDLLHVEAYTCSSAVVKEPYEGHYLHTKISCSALDATARDTADYVKVSMGASTDRFVMSVLEPACSDSYYAWNFFDATLQRKEWFNTYVYEDIAAERLKNEPDLRTAYDAWKTANPDKAGDAWEHLFFIFQRSPGADQVEGGQQVLRVVDR